MLRKRWSVLRGMGAYGIGLVACISIYLQVTATHGACQNFGRAVQNGVPRCFSETLNGRSRQE